MKKYFLTVIFSFVLAVLPSQVFALDITTIQTQVVNYLPYILIGGAAILLVSIIGILFSKKKEDGGELTTSQTTTPIENAAPAQPVEQATTPVQAINMDEISSNLYSPAESKPSIQETMESTQAQDEQSITQPTFTEPQTQVTQQDQSSDLQDILQGEASTSPMGPITDHSVEETPATTQVTEPSVTPINESPVTPVFEETNPIPDLQQFVDTQTAQIPPVTQPETTAAAPTENSTPVTDTPVPTPTTPGII